MREPYFERMIKEAIDLEEKTIKLDNFIKSRQFIQLDKRRANLMAEQLCYMRLYYITLVKRIKIEDNHPQNP